MFNNITVIGSGLMGSAIAAHLANAGCKVNLLDIIDKNNENKNHLADLSLEKLIKIKPSPLTLNSNVRLIKTGNIDENLNLINKSEWVIEVIIENLDIKKDLYRKIDEIMKDDLIISSNTSTIPIKLLSEGLSKKFKKNFLITHFFNPPRYLKLLEVVKSDDTKKEIVRMITEFCDINLGKTVIETKDTPGFIGNRIGIFWIERAAVEAIKFDLTVEEADSVITNVFKVPKTGVFGLIDVVGLDLIPSVVKSLLDNIPKDDYYHSVHETPEIFQFMLENKMVGRKGDGGFYKLINVENKKIKHSLDLKTRKYSVSTKPKIINKNLQKFLHQEDKFSKYAWNVLSEVLFYVLSIAEEISQDINSIDEAMKNGFGWQFGPFEIIDKIGISFLEKKINNSKKNIPNLIKCIGENKFYQLEADQIKYFDFVSKNYTNLKRSDGILLLSDIKKTYDPIKRISTASLWDIGDQITVFEIHSKSNTIDMATMEFLYQCIDIVTSSYKAMIIYNEGDFFSAGANLGEALFLGNIGLDTEVEKNILIKGQEVFSKLKYSKFPVIAAPFNLALGGGCEIILHSDYVQAHIELYIGLTEAALGILPAWGGCKELLSRFSSNDSFPKGPMAAVMKTFELIGKAKVSTSAKEAKNIGYLKDSDGITMNRNRLLFDAKMKAIEMSKNYKIPEKNIYCLPGKTAVAAIKLTLENMQSSGVISQYDKFIGEKIAYVLSGGDTDITKEVMEENILKLEKDAIYNLMKENLTIERLEHILETGKYLRN